VTKYHNDDETLPNFIKRKHPRKREKKKQSARTAVQVGKRASKRRVARRKGKQKSPKEAGHMEEREPLSIKISISCMKHMN
jgi:hypothetical protein